MDASNVISKNAIFKYYKAFLDRLNTELIHLKLTFS
jgi:hypothetical protein